MKKIWEILWKSLSKYNLTSSAFSLIVIYRFRKHLVDIFWEKILKIVNIKKYQNDTIYVKCNSAAWAQQI